MTKIQLEIPRAAACTTIRKRLRAVVAAKSYQIENLYIKFGVSLTSFETINELKQKIQELYHFSLLTPQRNHYLCKYNSNINML